MHSAIFSVVDTAKMDAEKMTVSDLPLPDGNDLFEWMNGKADYVQDVGDGWKPGDLIAYLNQSDYVKAEGDDVFAITEDDEYIKKEILRRVDAIKKFMETTDHSSWIAYYEARQMLDDTGSFYIALINPKYGLEQLSTVDEFVLDGIHAGKKYKIVAVNDYHF